METKIKADDLPIGAKLIFGCFSNKLNMGQEIRWTKVDATNIFLSEELKGLCFDGREPNSTQLIRRDNGNNYYTVSNLDQYLNSVDTDWYLPAHEADSKSTTYIGIPGFLSKFSENELNAIQPTEIEVILPGTEAGTFQREKEFITRKMFIPRAANIKDIRGHNREWTLFRKRSVRVNINTWTRDPITDDPSFVICLDGIESTYKADARRADINTQVAVTIKPDVMLELDAEELNCYRLLTNEIDEKDFENLV